MPAGIKADALTNAGRGIAQQTAAGNLQARYGGLAGNTWSTLFPTLRQNLTNPQGFGKDLNAINTANQQSIGGSVAGAVGQGNLQAARTGNAGGFAPALDEAARSGARQMSQNALGVQEQNAYLKNQQQQQAINALGNLYGENTNATLRALGLGNEALGESNNALSVATGAAKASPWNSFYDTLGQGLAGDITGQNFKGFTL